jgi:predicted RNA-binding Zn-ribbon protein involved in translation (DUF1610 family)
MPFCSGCGAEIDINDAFCPSCGNQLQARRQPRLNQNQNINISMSPADNVCPNCHGTRTVATHFVNPINGQDMVRMLRCGTCRGRGTV